jgi:hypothetical protein
MGVLIEGVNVVIRNAVVEERLPGGMQEYERRCPNATFCTDGDVCRVGFMTIADASAYIENLVSLGFARPSAEGSPEVALITQAVGFHFPCEWLELDWVDLDDGQSAEVVWAQGTTLSTLVAPPNWKPGKIRQFTAKDLGERAEFLGTENGVDIFRDKTTGEELYVGRTLKGAPPASINSSSVQERFASLTDELTHLGAFENAPAGDYRGNLSSLHQRAKQLVEDTQALEPGPIHLQGLVARLLNEWDEAASLFGRVTELRPEYLGGWLELTWALASLRRFEEAERAARRAVDLDPKSASTLGNLAAVLLEQGKIDEARQLAEKAVKADPADTKNRTILATAQRKVSRRPWWKIF